MELPSIQDMELPILSVFARAKRQGRDRRADGVGAVDPNTGLPLGADGLLPRSRVIGGEKLAMQIRVEPEVWATAFLALDWKHKDAWSDEEIFSREELTMRIKKAVRAMSERGLFSERYAGEFDGQPMPLGVDGFCVRAAITAKGLDEAVTRCAGTKWEHGPRSILAGAPREIVDGAPEWAKAEQRQKD